MFVKKETKKDGSQIGRRRFLKLAGGTAAGAFLLLHTDLLTRRFSVTAQTGGLSKFTEHLRVPPLIDATAGGTFNLPMAPSMHQFHSDLPPAPTWGYGGATYLGPTIEAKRHMPVTIAAQNQLGNHPLAFAIDTTLHGAREADKTAPRVSLHLHGGNTEAESDGHPDATFLPQQSRAYQYTNNQEAANLWYHDHALGITRLNVYAGLAGFYLLRDDWDTGKPGNPPGLPSGPYEVPLVIQDKMFASDGSLAYPPGAFGSVWAPEFFGDTAVVNGKVFPFLEVDRGLYRFRVINGSNARVYNLYLSGGHTIYQIGGDGGLLNAPVQLSRLILAPGERADLLIDFSNAAPGTNIILKNTAAVPFPDGPRSSRRGGVPLRDIMQFTVGNAPGFTGAFPAVLRQTPIIPLTNPVRVRNLTLVELADEETGEPVKVLLNNLPWDTTDIEMPHVDTVEQWNIINTTGDTHPIHLHLVQFQILSRQRFKVDEFLEANYPFLEHSGHANPGPYPPPSADDFVTGKPKSPELNEGGWKDTARANPGEILRIMVPFGANAAPGVPFGNSFLGDYVWHCHILEHEDNEMMLPYRIIA
jgi:FtsP/CotA-like multicopper oxidase with cupredoxin domain